MKTKDAKNACVAMMATNAFKFVRCTVRAAIYKQGKRFYAEVLSESRELRKKIHKADYFKSVVRASRKSPKRKREMIRRIEVALEAAL